MAVRVKMQGKMKGFTLVELMITVAIIAILAGIALPSYTQYLVKSRRAAAQAFMIDVAGREKQYFLDARDYAVDPGGLVSLGMVVPADVAKYYTFSLDAGAAPPSFVITATPVAGGAQAGDGALTLDNAGVKAPAGKW